MCDKESKSGGKKCPLGFVSGGYHSLGGGDHHHHDSGHGGCPYGFGSSHHGHGHGSGFGGSGGHCPFLQGGHFGGGGHHGFGGHHHHGFDQHHGPAGGALQQCPWMVARMHACPWALGVGSGHRGHAGGHHDPCCDKKEECCKEGNFCVTLKVEEYCSEELEVKVVGKEVIVHGKHDARPDKLGETSTVSREFTRRYTLGDDIDPETVTSCLCESQELTICATKKVAEGEPRVVTIQVAGGSGDQ